MSLIFGDNTVMPQTGRARKAVVVVAIAVMMVLLLLVSVGCGCKKTETRQGTVLVNNVSVNAFNLKRGDTVEVLGMENGYYKVKYSGDSGTVSENGKGASTLLVEKGLIRLDSEQAPDEMTAFSKAGCQLFDNPYFEGTALATPEVDTELTVMDRFQRCSYVKLPDGKTGYVNPAFLGTEKEPEESDDDNDSSGAYAYGYYYSDDYSSEYYYEDSGGSSGGWSGGSTDTGGGTGADGDDIVITQSILSSIGIVDVAYAAESSTTQASGKGMVLADNTKSYIAFLNRGDTVDMVIQSSGGNSANNVEADGKVNVLIDGQIGTMPASLVRDSESAPYTEWTGYATADAPVFGDYTLLGEIKVCENNTLVTVLDDIGSCYVVRVDGVEGYMAKDQVSTTENEEVAEEEESSGGGYSYYSYYYGGSSEGTSVDTGNTGSAQSVIEAATGGGWTEEKL